MTHVTVEILIQGGIEAAYGVNAVFMVQSVMAVSRPSRLTRERHGGNEAETQQRNQNSLFAEVLKKAAQDIQEAPTQYQTTVYGRDRQLEMVQYQTREYHY